MKNVNITLGDTIYGPMMYLPNDVYVGRSLDVYGEFSIGEAGFFLFAAQKGGCAVDVGANMGAHSVAMAKKYEHVFSFEPQPTLFKLLRANLSEYLNTTSYQAAVGREDGIIHLPLMDYSIPNNFGALGRDCFEGLPAEQTKDIEMVKTQLRMIDKVEAIQAAEKIALIKVDVEGMEKDVLEGARQTIIKHQPILYVENDKPKKSAALVDYIYNNLAYKAYWHITSLYNPENYRQNPENVFPDLVSFNLICIPEGHWASLTGALPCTPDKPGVPEGCVT